MLVSACFIACQVAYISPIALHTLAVQTSLQSVSSSGQAQARQARAPHLQVGLRVPVGVEQHHDVGGVQVDAQPARARGQQEDELLAAVRVVRIDL